jgi:hypothetical protein
MTDSQFPSSGPAGASSPAGDGSAAGTGPSDGPVTEPVKQRMPGAVVAVLVIVGLHAVLTLFGAWAVVDENYSKQEHGQELIMPMGAAWAVAAVSVGLAAFTLLCVVLARTRRPWIRVAFAVWLGFLVVAELLAFVVSASAGVPSTGALPVLFVDAVALWVVLGETSREWFLAPARASATPADGWLFDDPDDPDDPDGVYGAASRNR